MATLPLDDPKTYEMLARGDSIGVFQFESDGMRDALRKVQARRSSRTSSRSTRSTARAPCASSTPTRATSATRTRSQYIDERLRPITESTYWVILYQEQSMQIAKAIAGFTGPEADDLRKAIGKKQRDRMAALRDRFFEGARATGTSRGGDPGAVGGQRGGGRLLVQQVPRRLLRPDLLPHRLAARPTTRPSTWRR